MFRIMCALAGSLALMTSGALAEGHENTGGTHDWSGFYLGLQAGYQWNEDDFADPVVPFFGSVDADGFVGGVNAGYYLQSGNWVYGVVGDFEFADGNGTAVAANTPAVFGSADINWQGSVRGRVGYAFNYTQIYATAGLAVANFDFDYVFPALPGTGLDRFDETVVGYTVGAGVEQAFNEYWSAWAEYRFSDFGTATSGIANCCAPAPNRQDHDVTSHALRIGISRKFMP